jgi:hypothetical protein
VFLVRHVVCTQRACRKSYFFKKRFFCWIRNRKLFSVIESFYNPWCNVPVSMIFFLPQSDITQSGSFTQTPDRINRNNHSPYISPSSPPKRSPLSSPLLI